MKARSIPLTRNEGVKRAVVIVSSEKPLPKVYVFLKKIFKKNLISMLSDRLSSQKHSDLPRPELS